MRKEDQKKNGKIPKEQKGKKSKEQSWCLKEKKQKIRCEGR